jgi:hypothetical protein
MIAAEAAMRTFASILVPALLLVPGASAGETPITGRRPATVYTEPATYHDGTCRRERRYAPQQPASAAAPRVMEVEVALAPNCVLGEGGFFAHLQPFQRFDRALAALHRFAALRAVAASPEPLPFEITCRSGVEPPSCTAGARTVLAGLPVTKVFIVQPGAAKGHWQAAVMPSGPGQPYWNVRWSEDGEERPVTVALSWEIPAPF